MPKYRYRYIDKDGSQKSLVIARPTRRQADGMFVAATQVYEADVEEITETLPGESKLIEGSRYWGDKPVDMSDFDSESGEDKNMSETHAIGHVLTFEQAKTLADTFRCDGECASPSDFMCVHLIDFFCTNCGIDIQRTVNYLMKGGHGLCMNCVIFVYERAYFEPVPRFFWAFGYDRGSVFSTLWLGFFHVAIDHSRMYYKRGFKFGMNKD